MKILAIDTSCDETAAAVTDGTKVLSNIIWSQASLHAKFGGVLPSLAQRQHEERIDFVVDKALSMSKTKIKNIDAITVTCGPGLAIALGVGINKAKELAEIYKKPLIPINHIEAHLLSPLARSNSKRNNPIINSFFPAFGLILSGGNTQFVFVEKVGKYKILAETVDDALGEALDKSARLLGFGYPGGEILEEFAKKGDPNAFDLPLPLKDDLIKYRFSYSGLKTAFVRLLKETGNPSKKQTSDLAASFQDKAFEHIIKVLDYQVDKVKKESRSKTKYLLFGGGVANNVEIRKRLRRLCKKHSLKLLVPYSKKLTTDNAAMIGVCAYLKIKEEKLNLKKYYNYDLVDRNARARIA